MNILFAWGALVVVALVIGWLIGASGKWKLQRAAHAAGRQLDLTQARTALIEARLDVYNVNFGEASRHLEHARSRLRVAKTALHAAERKADVARVDAAVIGIDEAQRLCGAMNQNANTRIADAVQLVNEILGARAAVGSAT